MFCTGDQSQLCHITQHFKKGNFSSLSVFFNGADDDIIQIQQTVCPGTEPVLLIK